ncbi:MAG: hypothetical protein ABSF92_05725 [Candidatus Acidiferrales bacterium]|jgi:hypothetical protein
MTATRTTRTVPRRASHAAKRITAQRVAARPTAKAVAAAPEMVLYRLCKPGWAVIVERSANAQGTRFVCPFCPLSHRVPGPVRGFKKLRRAQWSRLRRVEE